MLTIDRLEFNPKQDGDPDQTCVTLFNFETCGILFRNWKIRLKDGGYYSISPPYVKHLGERSDIVQFQDKEDFRHIARTAIQAAKENGTIQANPGRRY